MSGLLAADGRPMVQHVLDAQRAAFFAREARPTGLSLALAMPMVAHAQRLSDAADECPLPVYGDFLRRLAARISEEASQW